MKYEELLEQYGREYLAEHDPDREPFEMDMLPEYLPVNSSEDYFNLLLRVFNGYRYNPYEKDSDSHHREEFNPNNEYVAFTGYGNLMSIDEYNLVRYLDRMIDKDEFIEFCKEEGYIDEDEEIEEAVESRVKARAGCGKWKHIKEYYEKKKAKKPSKK